MKAKCAALLVGMILLGPSRAGATPITYAVSEFESAGNSIPTSVGVGIGGSITTDGTLGPIGAANIVDWSLIGTADGAAGVAIAQFLLNPSNSDLSNIVNVTATANALTLGVGSGVIIPNGDFLFTSAAFGSPVTSTIEFSVETSLMPPELVFEVCSRPQAVPCAQGASSDLTFADGKVIETTTPVATPLPAALPLFATGLGAIGLLGWRRKRKAQAVAA